MLQSYPRVQEENKEVEATDESDECEVSHRPIPHKYQNGWQDNDEVSTKRKEVVVETSTLRQAKKKKIKPQASKASPPKQLRREFVINIDDDEEQGKEKGEPKLTHNNTKFQRKPTSKECSEISYSSHSFKTSMGL